MDWLLQGAETINQDTLDTREQTYPFAQWVNGKQALKQLGGVTYTGGWFVNGEQVVGDTFDGWVKGELSHDKGGETAGFFSRDLAIAMIHMRRSWSVQVGNRHQVFAWSQYDQACALGKPSGKTQILGVIKGLEEFGPMFITVKGSSAKALTGKGGAIDQFDRAILTPANALVAKQGGKSRFARRAFWLAIGPQRDAKGLPIYTTVGEGANSSSVTLPTALGLPEKATDADLRAAYVGADLLKQVNAIYDETLEWAHAWDAENLARGANRPGLVEQGEYEEAGPEKPTEEIPF